MSVQKGWQRARNILCIRLDSLGDVLMITPALRALKEDGLGRKLTLLTSTSGAKIALLIPEVDETIIYDSPWMKTSRPSANREMEFQMIDRLRESAFDAVVIFTTFSQSPLPAALLTFMAGIPLRLAHCRENPYHLLTDWVHETDHFDEPNVRHEVRRQLDLVGAIGSSTTNERLSLQVSSKAIEHVHERITQLHLDTTRPWILIHPGATAPSRRYPEEGFAQAAQELASVYGFQLLFSGTEPEVELVERIRASMRADSFSLTGKLGIEEFSALISLAPLLISNNTGPVHIAAALNTPVIDLYALTNPQHTPWNVPHRTLFHDVPCKFCYKSICPMGHHNCLQLVSPAALVQAALELLEQVRVFG